MDVQKLAPGLWRWTAWHEEWKDDVGSVYMEAPDAVVLIDPLIPPEDEPRFWNALDRDVERAKRPVHILVTIFWHTRSAQTLAERYGARVWAPRSGCAPIARRAGQVSDLYRIGDSLPGGIEARPSGRSTEVVFWIPDHRALVPGDVILGADDGGLRLCPQSWLPQSVSLEQRHRALLPLLDLPVERVLVSHGEPVLDRGLDALASALAHAQSSSATAR